MPQFECRTCTKRDGAPHMCSRVSTKFTDGGKALAEPLDVCPCCDSVSTASTSTVCIPQQKLWLMQDVNPNEYETDKDGVKHLKDWAQGELEQRIAEPDPDEIDDDDIEAARARKRAQAQSVRNAYGSELSPDLASRIIERINEGAMMADAEAAGIVPMREVKREVPIVRP